MRQVDYHIGSEGVSPDEVIAELAATQHGAVSREQLLAAGFTPRSVMRRLGAGRLHQLHRGVYAVGHTALLPGARYMAAVLAVGEGAVLSHRAAGARLGLCPVPSGEIDVTVLRRGGRSYDGISLHVTRSLPDSEITELDNIPCTTWARTLVDLAGVLNERQLKRALERTVELQMFDLVAMVAALARAKSKPGTGRLRRLVAALTDDSPHLASELERLFLELIRTADLPQPVVNGHIGDLQVDFHWPAFKLVVETDGKATHGHAIAFHRDRDRDLYLNARGWRVLRLTWRHVVNEPERVAEALRRLFAELGFGGAGLGGGALA